MPPRTAYCGCDEEECVCHFFHYDCACNNCPDCFDDCFCYEVEEAEGITVNKPKSLMEVFEDYPELFGERIDIDPFDDDEVIEPYNQCDLENPEICDTCQ